MLERQFHAALAAARTGPEVDELARRLYALIADERLTDADAEALEAALQARRAALAAKAGGRPGPAPKAASEALGGLRSLPGRRREKMFGAGRHRALDRNAKVRIMHLARCLSRRTEKGRHYGAVTAKALAVLDALLWGFHNGGSGLCFPSYERIAEAAHCARSTVHGAIAALEAAGLLSWVNRLKRVREAIPGLPGVGATRVRVVRTSNAYEFRDPGAPAARPDPSKSDLPSRTGNQVFPLLSSGDAAAAKRLVNGPVGSISRLHNAVGDCQLEGDLAILAFTSA